MRSISRRNVTNGSKKSSRVAGVCDLLFLQGTRALKSTMVDVSFASIARQASQPGSRQACSRAVDCCRGAAGLHDPVVQPMPLGIADRVDQGREDKPSTGIVPRPSWPARTNRRSPDRFRAPSAARPDRCGRRGGQKARRPARQQRRAAALQPRRPASAGYAVAACDGVMFEPPASHRLGSAGRSSIKNCSASRSGGDLLVRSLLRSPPACSRMAGRSRLLIGMLRGLSASGSSRLSAITSSPSPMVGVGHLDIVGEIEMPLERPRRDAAMQVGLGV